MFSNFLNTVKKICFPTFLSRVVLFVIFLLSGAGPAWGQTRHTLNITINGDGNETKIPLSEFSGYGDDCIVEFNFNNNQDSLVST